MTGNSSCPRFETAEDHHRLPAGLPLDLLNGRLYCGCKVVDGAIR